MKLEQVVPWGRSRDEYVRMFALTPDDLRRRILDCAGGPASFNTELTHERRSVISCDPLYGFTAAEIQARIAEIRETVIANARDTRNEFVWDEFVSPERLGEIRMAIMQRFLEDFPQGLEERRYRTGELPRLPFEDGAVDLALCSHFLFTYSEQFTADFHVAAIQDMCRVADEARVFPLLKAYGGPSPHLAPVMETLRKRGYHVEKRRVLYEFQRGGNEMLTVTR